MGWHRDPPRVANRGSHTVRRPRNDHRRARTHRGGTGAVRSHGGADDRARRISSAHVLRGVARATLMQPVHITPAGALIALLFAASISAVLFWMLRLPEQTPTTLRVARAVRLAQHANRILVPLQGGAVSDRIVALGAQMARARRALMEVYYIIQVPSTLPLGARLPEEESCAREVLD